MKQGLLKFLKYKALKLRYLSIISTSQAGSGHVTSALSASDIISVLFFYSMKYDPNNFQNPNNDRFILSKGHAAPVLYAAWSEVGVIKEEELLTLRKFNSRLEGHPTPRFPSVEAATGSLGQGLSIGAGIALSAKLDKRDFFTYVLLGDSETSEGQIWEAAEIAAYYKLDNLIAILDVNGLGQTGETMFGWDTKKYVEKFESFGWRTFVINGHNIKQIADSLDKAKIRTKKPTIIIAKTIKGYGVKSVENKNGYHGKAFDRKKLSEILNGLHKRFPDASKFSPEDYNWEPNLPKMEKSNKKNKNVLNNPKYKMGNLIATREVYGDALVSLAKNNSQFICLDAEVSNSTFSEKVKKKYPNQFIECFIAEQNMISMGVGLSTRKKIVFCSTFSCFMTRAFDQLRMAAISKSPLKICGSHSGVSIGQDGPSQMGLEDISMFRTFIDSVIFYTSDAVSTYKVVELMSNYTNGISYLKTTRMPTSVIYRNEEKFEIGGCKVIKQNLNEDQVCVIAAGITLHEALKAYEQLKKENIFISIIDLYCIKPIDSQTILSVAKKSKDKIITVEDHYLEGGIGEAVIFALKNQNIYIECLAVKKLPTSGMPEELMNYEDIDSKAIIKLVKQMKNKK